MKKKIVEPIVRVCLYLVIISLLIWSFQTGAFQFITEHPEDFMILLKQHLRLVGVSGLCAIAFSVPLGILVTRPRFRKYQWIVTNFANIGQTIPSLAVLAIIMTYLGIGYQTAIIALWVNSLLPILRNTIAGIEGVSPVLIDAGQGMGMSARQIFWKLELPNSLYAILAGIRTSVVINVGTAALAFLIGGGGFGDLIFTGIALFDTGIMLSGAVPVIMLAVALDMMLGLVEKKVVPKGLQRKLEAAEI